MFKKPFLVVALVLILCLSSVAVAEVSNRDLQLLGGVAISNSQDTFFFAPMETGVTKHWALYALSTAKDGPIKEITNGYPARLVHADLEKVYFWGYTDPDRSVHTLYSVAIDGGATEDILTDVASAFIGDDDTSFLYVTKADPYTLRKYDIKSKKDTKIKDMSGSKKSIYDAVEVKGNLFFLTKSESGVEDAYEYHASSGKATNLDKPSPDVIYSLLYEGYRIYSNDSGGTRIFSVKVGNKKAVQMGQKYATSLSSFRFGEAMYVYDGENNLLVRCPLDGSAESTLAIEGGVLKSVCLGGTKDELLLLENKAIYAVKPDLSSQNKLFDMTVGGHMWSHIAPANDSAILLFGYDANTLTHRNNLMPTGVYAFDRATGELLFGFPEWNPDAEEEETTVDATNAVPPEGLGKVPEETTPEGETTFVF